MVKEFLSHLTENYNSRIHLSISRLVALKVSVLKDSLRFFMKRGGVFDLKLAIIQDDEG